MLQDVHSEFLALIPRRRLINCCAGLLGKSGEAAQASRSGNQVAGCTTGKAGANTGSTRGL